MNRSTHLIYLLFLLVFHTVESTKLPRSICPNPRIQNAYELKRISQSQQKVAEVDYSVSKTVFSVGNLQSFRVDEGDRSLEFVLLFQDFSATQGGNIRVNIWVENAKYIEQSDNYLNTRIGTSDKQADRRAMIEEMGEIMVVDIVPSMVSTFGAIQPVLSTKSDGLNVFIYDIQDSFQFSGEFVGGYFDPADKFDSIGNRMNSIHMDLYPSNPGGAPIPLSGFGTFLPRKDFYHVLAHELQHLIHSQFDNDETIWVNEGFSQFAIYRVFHGKRFDNGDPILDSPNDAPSQVEFWLQDPDFSLLMSNDEPGIQGGSFQRSDSAELRGVGYLFFSYLWEVLGGQVGIGGILESGGADQAFRAMIASSSKGIASLESTLNQNSKNFRDLFSRFAYGLVEETSSIAPFEFFDYHTNGSRSANLNLGISSRTIDASFVPTSFLLAGYEFAFHKFTGPSTSSSTLELSASREFDIYSFSSENGGWKLNSYDRTDQLNLWIPRSSTILTILVNPELETLSIQSRYLNSLTADTPAPPEDLSGSELAQGGNLTPLSLGAQTITSQRFTNSTTVIVDLLNPRPEDTNIRKCLANQSCIQASYQRVSTNPVSRRIRRTSIKIGGTDYFYSDLQLQPGQAYDLYYANTSTSSFSFSPRATVALDLFDVTSGETTPTPTSASGAPVFTGSGGGGGCFLATAAFSGDHSPEVRLLSRFRDQILLKTRFGRTFVQAYYTYSPIIAEKIQNSQILKGLTRVLLLPVLALALSLDHPLFLFLILFGIGLFWSMVRFPSRAQV